MSIKDISKFGTGVNTQPKPKRSSRTGADIVSNSHKASARSKSLKNNLAVNLGKNQSLGKKNRGKTVKGIGNQPNQNIPVRNKTFRSKQLTIDQAKKAGVANKGGVTISSPRAMKRASDPELVSANVLSNIGIDALRPTIVGSFEYLPVFDSVNSEFSGEYDSDIATPCMQLIDLQDQHMQLKYTTTETLLLAALGSGTTGEEGSLWAALLEFLILLDVSV